MKSLMEPKRDWQALDRKLASGMLLDDAASVCGIPLEEAQRYVDKRLQNGDDAKMQMRVIGTTALACAAKRLMEIASEPPRERMERLRRAFREVEGEAAALDNALNVKVTLYNTDLDAAKALAKLGVDLMKMAGPPPAPKSGAGGKLSVQLDLWDNPGNWNLKKPE